MKGSPNRFLVTTALIVPVIGMGGLGFFHLGGRDLAAAPKPSGEAVEIVDPAMTCGELLGFCRTELNGFATQQRAGGYLFELRYLPKEFQACRAADMNDNVTQRLEDEQFADARADQYLLRITPDAGEEGRLFDLESLLSGGLQSHVHALVGTDSVPCAFVHIESGPAHTPATSILLGFETPQDDSDRRVILSDLDDQGSRVELGFAEGLFARYVTRLNCSRTP